MKKTKLFLLSAAMVAALSVNTVRGTEPEKSGSTELTECKSCGVTDAQIAKYVTGLGHTVNAVVDIAGTCNSTVYIENCQYMTVYVQAGIVVGHSDASGFCGGSIQTGHQQMTATN